MRALTYLTPNPSGMPIWHSRRREHRKLTSLPIAARAIKPSPNMRPRPGLPQAPAMLESIVNGSPDVLVGVIAHAVTPVRFPILP